MATKTHLSVEPYKGTRDFYPEDMAIQNYLFAVMRRVVERYGYVEYGASIIEDTDIYRAKSGSELVNEQTYTFVDRGGRDVTIRPEMTPTVARMVARRRMELPFPLRWYSIPNLMRYERPQKGRLREHWQLNVDMFGVNSVFADSEIVTIAHAIMKEYGARDKDFTIQINNRKLINHVLRRVLGLSESVAYDVGKLIDRIHKISKKEFEQASRMLVGEKEPMLTSFLNTRNLDELPLELTQNEGSKELSSVIEILKDKGITNAVFDPTLMRGLDYYTGTVFEVFDTSSENTRSIFGGGRYDDLVGMFGVEKVTGVGFGMGDVTIRNYLETHRLLPSLVSITDVYICVVDIKDEAFAESQADLLRARGVRVAVDYSNRKIGQKIKTAEKQRIPFVICVGENERNTGILTLKHLENHVEKKMSIDEIVQEINTSKNSHAKI